jgi:hypothetical protein
VRKVSLWQLPAGPITSNFDGDVRDRTAFMDGREASGQAEFFDN